MYAAEKRRREQHRDSNQAGLNSAYAGAYGTLASVRNHPFFSAHVKWVLKLCSKQRCLKTNSLPYNLLYWKWFSKYDLSVRFEKLGIWELTCVHFSLS